jgi:hypothetical protein
LEHRSSDAIRALAPGRQRNRVRIDVFESAAEAEAARAEFEARAHKQMYWVEEVAEKSGR